MNRQRTLLRIVLGAALLAACAGGASARVVPAAIVVMQGDALGPGTVSSVNTPFTDGAGRVGFVGALDDGQRFIWWDSGPVFFSSDALPEVLTGGESTMGVSDTGGFIYSPAVGGNDAVYTHGGTLLKKTDPVPCLPGLYSSFNSRPTMLPNAIAHWVGGTATTPTGSTSNRHLFRAVDPTDPETIERLLGGGDVIEGKTVKTTASNFNYWISDNGLHHIHILDMDVAASENEHVYLDGVFIAQEGQPTGQGDHWSSFDIVGVNDAGDYIFTGDTDGPTTTDEFVAFNGKIVVREGDTLDGVTIPAGAALRAASINNVGDVLHMWGSSANEYLFFGPGARLAQSVCLLATGDSLDVDGDQVADFVVTDFNASTTIGPGLDLADGRMTHQATDPTRAYLDVDLSPIGMGTGGEAIIGIATSPAPREEEGRSRDLVRGGSAASAVILATSAPGPQRGGTIRYRLAEAAAARLALYDIAGRQVRLLQDGPAAAGIHELAWDGRDAGGARLPAGAYFLRLDAPGASAPGRLVLVR
ncbi:MAG: hypothetical protein FJY75_01865 [Candidatus Eisenbacteria bacterium]|uniref:FlgD/Vpr Ig-like domain-containing protein n=1 Tax=Eiseniibacteriota bacterium TaxID=2212470 RepID=A0A938BPZ2_UNCEI|nr:hypothetical protein [Candidatus Eisenbacteria bacterium]